MLQSLVDWTIFSKRNLLQVMTVDVMFTTHRCFLNTLIWQPSIESLYQTCRQEKAAVFVDVAHSAVAITNVASVPSVSHQGMTGHPYHHLCILYLTCWLPWTRSSWHNYLIILYSISIFISVLVIFQLDWFRTCICYTHQNVSIDV